MDLKKHSLFVKMMQTGCTNQKQLICAFHVFMDLCENHCAWNVDICYDATLNLLFLETTLEQGDSSLIYLPFSSTDSLSMEDLIRIDTSLTKGRQAPKIVLCFCDPDSTIVYYTATAGLVPPETEEEEKRRKEKEEIKRMIQVTLYRKKGKLLEEARRKKDGVGEKTTLRREKQTEEPCRDVTEKEVLLESQRQCLHEFNNVREMDAINNVECKAASGIVVHGQKSQASDIHSDKISQTMEAGAIKMVLSDRESDDWGRNQATESWN